MGYKILGAEGKAESQHVELFMKQMFDGLASDSYLALASVGLNPHRASQRELDLLLYLSWRPKPPVVFPFKPDTQSVYCLDTGQKRLVCREETTCILSSVLVTVEVKSHDARAIRVRGNDIDFLYKNPAREEWKCATAISIEQARTAADFVENHFGIRDRAARFIYLPSVRRDQIRVNEDLGRILLFADSTYQDLINKLLQQQGMRGYSDPEGPRYLGDGRRGLYHENGALYRKIEGYFRQLVPSRLEQPKLEKITKKYIESQQWAQEIGKKMVAFTGPAGTGKTVRLLRAARDIAEQGLENVLVLTFNQALARDLQRLMQLQTVSGRSGITVKTIYEFLFQIAYGMNILEKSEVERYAEEQDSTVYDAVRALLVEALQDPSNMARVKEQSYGYTMVAIDEAQDWYEEERRIVLSVFPPNKVLIAVGTDQCLRAPSVANWKGDAQARGVDVKVIPGKVALRQTSNLSDFSNALAGELGLDWRVERNPQLTGGEIYYFQRFDEKVLGLFLEELIRKKDDYFAIDFLMLQGSGGKESHRIRQRFDILRENGWDYWDAVTKEDRKKLPELAEVRNVSLESCRGLEGWATVVFDLDQWLQFALKREALLRSGLAFQSLQTLPSWFLIPFTRAKQRMLIEMPQNPELREVLLRIQRANPGAITTIN